MEYGLCTICPYSTDSICYYTRSDCGPLNRWYAYQQSSVGICFTNGTIPYFSWSYTCLNLITQSSKDALKRLFTTTIVADDVQSSELLKGYEPTLYLLHIAIGTIFFGLLYLRNLWAVAFQHVFHKRYEVVIECICNLVPTTFMIGYAIKLYMTGIKWDLHSILGILLVIWVQVQTLTSGRFIRYDSTFPGESGTLIAFCALGMVFGSTLPFRYEVGLPILSFFLLTTLYCVLRRLCGKKIEPPLTSAV